MEKVVNIIKIIYFYTIIFITAFLLFKCYEYYFFNDFFIKIPNVVDISYNNAKIIERKGLKIKIIGEIASTKPLGTICKQNPYPGSLLKRGSNIKVFLSKGIKRNELPNVKGDELNESQKILKEKNILVGNIDFTFNENIDFNKVIATDPEEKTFIPVNKKVSLLVSKGSKNKISFIPDIIGLDFEKVKDILEEEGLLIGKINYKKSTYDKNIVLDVFPKIGEKVFKGTLIDIVVSE